MSCDLCHLIIKNLTMKKTITLILLSLTFFCKAQNLVNNWSFEDTISCPLGLGDITKASGWSSYKETPDYFNSCNTDTIGTSFAGVPENYFGYQNAKSGNAFTGFYVYYPNTLNYREILGSQLSAPLNIGQKYFVSFFINRASREVLPNHNINIATNKIGARFTNTLFSYNSPIEINNWAHIFTDSIISDTTNWVKISGSFVADSAYQYIAIGNFFSDSATSHISFDTISFAAYYFIDEIRVSTDSVFVNSKSDISSHDFFKIYPNPARDWIVLEGKGIKSVAILNALGSEIGYYPTTAFTLLHQINFGTLSCGVYFLKINMIDDKFHFQKIIVQY